MDFNETAVFVKVVQTGSFSAAARQLGLPTSTVSTRISRLEKRLGVTLLQRTTRRLSLTEAGSVFYEHSAVGMEHMLDAENAVTEQTSEAKGFLRVSAPPDFGDALLASIIRNVRKQHPMINVELSLDDHYVNLIEEAMDVAIRIGDLQDSSMIAKRVGDTCWAPFASPEYLQNASLLSKPQHLNNHVCLQFTSLGKDEWVLLHKSDSIKIPMERKIVVNDLDVIRSMAIAGDGVALLPTYACLDDFRAGKLVRVLPKWYARADPVHLVFPQQKFIPSKLRIFIDIATLELRRWLDQPNTPRP